VNGFQRYQLWINKVSADAFIIVLVKHFELELDRVLPIFRDASQHVNEVKKLLDSEYQKYQTALKAIDRFDQRSGILS
jgi:hypothetical protein